MQATKPGGVVRRGGQWVPAGRDYVGDNTMADVVETGPGEGERPWKTATRAEWDEYARSQGVNPEDYSSKDDLIAALG